MDDLQPIKDFRNEVAVPATAREEARTRLVERMAGRPRRLALRRRRRLVVAVATLVAAAVAAGTATGLVDRLLDAIRGKPAPATIQERFRDFDDRDVLVPLFEHRSGVIARRAHGVLASRTSAGTVALWAAPTRRGTVCFELTWFTAGAPGNALYPIQGGCGPFTGIQEKRVLASTGSHENTWPPGRPSRHLDFVFGVTARGVPVVELQTLAGTRRRVRVFERFFFAEVRSGETLDAVVALDARGRRVGRYSFTDQPVPPPTPPGPEPVGSSRQLVRLRSQGRVFTLHVTASTAEGRCFELTVDPGEDTPLLCPRLGSEPLGGVYPQEQRVPGPPYALLVGEVRPRVRSVELRYEDGAAEMLPLVDSFVLFVVPREHHARGRRVALLVARDAKGRIIDRRRLDRRG